MQISKNYVLRTIAGDNLLVPLGGSSTETKGMVLLNEMSLFVYESIQKGQTEDEILSRILDEYDVEAGPIGISEVPSAYASFSESAFAALTTAERVLKKLRDGRTPKQNTAARIAAMIFFIVFTLILFSFQ